MFLVVPALAGAVKDLFVVANRYLGRFGEASSDPLGDRIRASALFDVDVREVWKVAHSESTSANACRSEL